MARPSSNARHKLARRMFLEKAALAGATVRLVATESIGRASAAEPSATSVRLGGPIFDKPDDPEQLALAHRQRGYRAAYCPAVSLSDSPRIRNIERAFAEHDVVIAEVGRWVNLLDADPEKRKANLQAVTDGLALADQIGARCCVDIAGSY